MRINTQSLLPIINFIWTVADDVLINKYLENQYQDVILPVNGHFKIHRLWALQNAPPVSCLN